MKRFTSIAAAVFTAAFLTAATSASAQDSNVNQRTFLTFSGPVQMPGVTLPAGTAPFVPIQIAGTARLRCPPSGPKAARSEVAKP